MQTGAVSLLALLAPPQEALQSNPRNQPVKKQPKQEKAGAAPAAPPIDKSRYLQVIRDATKTEDRQFAELLTNGIAVNATTTVQFGKRDHSGLALTEVVNSLEAAGRAVNDGDTAGLERMLTAQAISLNTMFAEMAWRASLNMGNNLDAMETYMRLALRAQNQSRSTAETLATIKNPPVVFARQANINNGGQQQVNNGAAGPALAPAEESKTQQTKLLEETTHVERLDAGAPSAPGKAHQDLEAVGVVHRPPKRARAGNRVA
jgi:hypothetical protein